MQAFQLVHRGYAASVLLAPPAHSTSSTATETSPAPTLSSAASTATPCTPASVLLQTSMEDRPSPLPVFSMTSAQRTAQGWIASIPEAAFLVRVVQLPSSAVQKTTAVTGDWTLRVFLDGQRTEYLVTPGVDMGYSTRELSAGGVRRVGSGGPKFESFVFKATHAAITAGNTTSAAAPTADEKLGTIRLEVHRVKIVDRMVGPIGGTGTLTADDVDRKATNSTAAHLVGLGPARPAPAWHTRVFKVDPFDPLDTGPWVVFEFKYRPKDELESMGIISSDAPLLVGVNAAAAGTKRRAEDDQQNPHTKFARLEDEQPRLDDEEQEIAELKARLELLEARKAGRTVI